jgi:hypothetical protein
VKFLTIVVLVMKGCVLNLQTLTSVVFMNLADENGRWHTFTSYNQNKVT